MITVRPGPRHLYFVTLSSSAAVSAAPLISPFLPNNQANWYRVALQAATPLTCDSLTVSRLDKDGVQQTSSKVPGIQLVTTDSPTSQTSLTVFITLGQRSRIS